MPVLSRVALIGGGGISRALRDAAGVVGVEVWFVAATPGAEWLTAVEAAATQGADGVLAAPVVPNLAIQPRLAEVAIQHRLPTMYTFREPVEAGGLLSYGPHLLDLWRRAGPVGRPQSTTA